MGSEILLTDSIVEFKDQEGMVAVMLFLERAKRKIKELEEKFQPQAVAFFNAHPDLKEIEIGPDEIIYKAHDKKERWRTQKIYELFKFTLQQQSILEANPNFRKTEMVKATGLEDTKAVEAEFMDIEWTDKVKVKTLNKKFIKGAK